MQLTHDKYENMNIHIPFINIQFLWTLKAKTIRNIFDIGVIVNT